MLTVRSNPISVAHDVNLNLVNKSMSISEHANDYTICWHMMHGNTLRHYTQLMHTAHTRLEALLD